MKPSQPYRWTDIRHPERAAWLAAAIGLAGTGLAALAAPQDLPHAWLSSAVLFSGWPLGSIALLLIHPLTGGRWGDVLTPALRLGASATPLLVLLWAPIALDLPALYPWTGHHVPNAWYLNIPFFSLRGVIYLVVWCILAALVVRGRARSIAAPGLILLGLTLNFAAIDATMSLEPTFNSSAYGMLAATGCVLLALAIATAITGATIPRHVRGDLGKLLLGLVVLWLYFDFMQLLIVWQSDLVSEAPYYAARMHGFWGVVLALVVTDHFLLPFAVLLLPKLQRSNLALTTIAVLLVAAEALRTWWTILPAVPRALSWVDIACLLLVGGIAAAYALRIRTTRFGTSPAVAHA